MQHVHPSTGGSNTSTATKFFGDRRIRPHNNHYNHHHHHVALKCPRCESINTKFCYYNNYNLSQPRHFCKNCRRYWTKGGVLRNVPVGGGCRKQTKKRSSSTKNNDKVVQSLNLTTNSTNSSDHDSSTSATVGPTTTPGGGAVSESMMDRHHENNLEFLFSSSSSGAFEPLIGASSTVEISQNNNMVTFDGFDMRSDQGGGVIDPTVNIDDLLQNRGSNGGLAALDWQHDHQGLFDVTSNSLDHHQGYWGQMTSSHHHFNNNNSSNNINNHNQWSDNSNYNYYNGNITNNDYTLFLN